MAFLVDCIASPDRRAAAGNPEAPAISNLKLIGEARKGEKIELSLDFKDGDGDIVAVEFTLMFENIIRDFRKPAELSGKTQGNYVFTLLPVKTKKDNECRVFVRLVDKTGKKSNELKLTITLW